MCVIIEKLAAKEIPFEHLLAGAHRNPDGYGVVVVDRGKLEVIRGTAQKFTGAAEAVAKVLEQAKGQLAFVHYRFRTVGDVSIENVQPFKVFKDANHEVQFMHNGTLNGFRGPISASDTAIFVEQVVAPLAKRTAALLGPEAITGDLLIAEILREYAGTSSKFALIDSAGNSLVVNRKSGVEQPYGWTSNGYSVDTTPIRGYLKSNEPLTGTITKLLPAPSGTTSHSSLVEQLNAATKRNQPSPLVLAPSVRATVHDLTGKHPKAFAYLDGEQVRELVDDEPDLAAILILDLVALVYGDEFKQAA